MKRIFVLIIVLLIAIVTMAYLYFSGLNTEKKNNDSALYAISANAAFIFAFQNDSSIVETLSSQTLLSEMLSDEKTKELKSLAGSFINSPVLNHLADQQNIYIGVVPGPGKNIEFLFSIQLNPHIASPQVIKALNSAGLKVSTNKNFSKIVLADSSTFYIRIKDNLLQLSGNEQVIKNSKLMPSDGENKFAEYILSTSKLTKSSLAEVYINFSTLPALIGLTMPGKLSAELFSLKHQDAYATLVYNYSTGHILFNGSTVINGPGNYYQLYTGSHSLEMSVDNILPANTANYTSYIIADYSSWNKSLNNWFSKTDLEKAVDIPKQTQHEYHLDLLQTFPKYFKNQLITFQLSTGEKLGAIALSDGEKLYRSLLDLSSNYSEDIKLLKVSDLLFIHFGEPFRKFKKPYYTIIDNYMVFANNASSVQSFLNDYRNNRLLTGNTDYIASTNKLPNASGITFYIDLKNSSEIIRRNMYLPYYRLSTNKKKWGSYSSFIVQLTGEKNKWQTNILLNKKIEAAIKDSLMATADSLMTLH